MAIKEGVFLSLQAEETNMVWLYHPATNAILVEPIKSRATAELIRSQDKIYKFLISRNYKPTYQVLDNECPEVLQ